MSEPTADATLRQLERAAAAAPDDGAARLRLARELERRGAIHAALAALELATFPDDGFEAARALGQSLWERDLLEWRRAAAPACDDFQLWWTPCGRYVGWRQDSGALGLGDTVTREKLTPRRPPRIHTVRFSTDRAFVSHEDGRIEELDLRDDARSVTVRDPGDARLTVESVALEGDRVVLRRRPPEGARGENATFRLCTWPGLDVLADSAHEPVGVWESRRLVVSSPSGSSQLAISIEDGRPRPLPDGAWLQPAREGHVAAISGQGVRLCDVATGRVLEAAGAGRVHSISIASDRRGVRFAAGKDRFGRIDVDLARGTVRTPPLEAARRIGTVDGPETSSVRWHPHADVCADGTEGLRRLDGSVLRAFERGVAMGFSKDGSSLYVRRRHDDGWRSEIWRSPTAPRSP